tara:strand:+ start:241 stop:639 length:399 start_codon:yes stop_codon:yes gene_type:complete
MPVYKALILNKEIPVNYKVDEKDKLEQAINEVNLQLKNYGKNDGKISDTTLLSFLAIKLQAEILELKRQNTKNTEIETKLINANSNTVNLNDKLNKLTEQKNLIENENQQINKDLAIIQNQINLITELLKNL